MRAESVDGVKVVTGWACGLHIKHNMQARILACGSSNLGPCNRGQLKGAGVNLCAAR